ncbi:MAG TPA: hypothetical protein VNE58_18300 [Casimicrobiaceae bacterium]|nr:hypothetical protein [Casimicrobiaceae bacterium]
MQFTTANWKQTFVTLASAIVLALTAWLAWRGYRNPDFLIDLANAMVFC